jgi:hypothetical protein
MQEKAFSAFLRTLFREDWVVYAKRPFGGPEHVLHYLARYTHRVAISNHRLGEVTDTHVSFRWKDYAHRSKRRVMTLSHEATGHSRACPNQRGSPGILRFATARRR